MQYVKVDLDGRAYTYCWPDKAFRPLEVGDIVLVPGNIVNPRPQQAPVIRLLEESDYDGKITKILAVADESARELFYPPNSDLL